MGSPQRLTLPNPTQKRSFLHRFRTALISFGIPCFAVDFVFSKAYQNLHILLIFLPILAAEAAFASLLFAFFERRLSSYLTRRRNGGGS